MDNLYVKVYVLDMPKVIVKKQSQMPAAESFQKISKMLEEDPQLKKLDPKYKCKFDSKTLSGTASGSQFKASLTVKGSNDGSAVEITVELPFHLALAKGIVESTLKKKIEEVLG